MVVAMTDDEIARAEERLLELLSGADEDEPEWESDWDDADE